MLVLIAGTLHLRSTCNLITISICTSIDIHSRMPVRRFICLWCGLSHWQVMETTPC